MQFGCSKYAGRISLEFKDNRTLKKNNNTLFIEKCSP